MAFPRAVRENALVKARRHCCVCHEFAGRSVNVHHIIQEADGGENTLENAIVLCLRCHAEAGHYNPKHPLGTKYAPSELIRHRDAWFSACESGAAIYASTIEAKVKRTYTSSELHKYVLIFNFHNGSKNTVSGWKLDVFFPSRLDVSIQDVEQYGDVNINGRRFKKFQVEGTEVVYLGESRELTDPTWTKLEYNIDHDIYFSASATEMKVLWTFYSNTEPPLRGELLWDELQEF
ncbi:HNH endonuclease [Marinobacter sp. AC-23]|uniref:HNH endonuclease n=1 Tax=Marinobacter sp. AC-23 TaxID=1879031 RepID=UPI0008DDD5A6|nr:HNH endonuclease signature motif containing protein [Marinobacter sp. AC-23]OHY71218.1 hypothetical protein BCA33_19510 [Marinobacter sp. AC-23]